MNSPPDHLGGDLKRKRKTLSCYDCRRRKLKCDREFPACGRCRKAGHAGTCAYEVTPPENANAHRDIQGLQPTSAAEPIATNAVEYDGRGQVGHSETVSSKLIFQEQKIALLESRLACLEERPAGTKVAEAFSGGHGEPHITKAHERSSGHPEVMFFKGRGFTTFLYGATNPSSMLGQFSEVKDAVADLYQPNSALVRAQVDMRACKNRAKRDRAASKPATDYSLSELIPDKLSADIGLNTYFETLGSMYCVIHKPSFMNSYEEFWKQPDQASRGFLVLVLLVLASVRCATREVPNQYLGDSSSPRDQAVLWIQACEKWVDNYSFKHAVVEVFQARCLLQIARAMNYVKVKQSWVSAKHAFHVAVSAGLHRDPSIMGEKAPFFDREMRRRVWATVAEDELSNCIFRGFPSSLANFPTDAAAPLNIYEEDMMVEHPGRPLDQFTPSSFLNNSQLPYEEIIRYDGLVTQALSELPQWKHTSISQKFVRNLLDIQLRQYLLLLHWPVTIRRGHGESRAAFSRTAVVNAAKSIIESHQDLVSSGSYVLCLLRTDIYRASICICQTYCQAKHIKNDLLLSNSPSSLVESALDMLESRLIRPGRETRHFMFVSAGYLLMRTATKPECYPEVKEYVVRRLKNMYDKILAYQRSSMPHRPGDERVEKEPSTEYLEGGSVETTAGPPTWNGMLPDGHLTGFEDFNFDDLSGWLTDDFWAYGPSLAS